MSNAVPRQAHRPLLTSFVILCKKCKAVPLQAWSGPEGSRKLRSPYFMTTANDGGKMVSLKHRPPLSPRNTPGTHFCSRLRRPQGHSAIGRIISMKNSNDTIWNRTSDLNHCATALPVILRNCIITCTTNYFHVSMTFIRSLQLPRYSISHYSEITVHCRAHISPPFVPIPSIRSRPISLRSISTFYPRLNLVFLSCLLPSSFLARSSYTLVLVLMHSTCLLCVNLLDLITLILLSHVPAHM